MNDNTVFTARPAGDGTDGVVILVDAATAIQLAWDYVHLLEVESPAARPLWWWDVAALKRAAADATSLTGCSMPVTYVPLEVPAPQLRLVGGETS